MLDSPRAALLAGQDAESESVLRRILGPWGFVMLRAPNGRTTIEVMTRQRVHVLVLNVEMPDMSGLDTYRVIRLASTFVPCVLTTQRLTRRVQIEALDIDAYSLIPKPLRLDRARSTLEGLVRKYYGS
jgi:DNA-binding response OmpR family regulator